MFFSGKFAMYISLHRGCCLHNGHLHFAVSVIYLRGSVTRTRSVLILEREYPNFNFRTNNFSGQTGIFRAQKKDTAHPSVRLVKGMGPKGGA